LREIFGDDLDMGPSIERWGWEQRKIERNLAKIAIADDAGLKVLPEVLPDLAEFLRPYQRADVAFMAHGNIINANEPGLGKTVETIAAVFEAELDDGPQLVVAPKTSLGTVWQFELDEWVGDPVYILSGDTTRGELDTILGKVLAHQKRREPFWFVTTAAQLRKGLPALLAKMKWKTIIIDEYHTTGLVTVSGDLSKGTQFGKLVRGLKRERLFLVSGTPMGGKPIKLWGALHHIDQIKFSSKWRWAELWLNIEAGWDGHKKIGGIQRGREDEFYKAHAQYIVRRLKAEVVPELPPIQRINVWCDMTKAQQRQYAKMERDAEVRIDEYRLSAVGVLAEYTRLKQFANAECSIATRLKADGEEEVRLIPMNSGKLDFLVERLDEVGIRKKDDEGEAVAVVASQSRQMVDWVCFMLNKMGIKAEKITGKISERKRNDLVRRFQSGTNAPRVLCVTTTAGGVAITLDRADTIHILDETWNPDDQEQLEDRVHRISRIHQVTAYYYRSIGTVEEDIYKVAQDKHITTKNILDVRRQIFKERGAD
jgi:SNF2 family DNA or RNA helicase